MNGSALHNCCRVVSRLNSRGRDLVGFMGAVSCQLYAKEKEEGHSPLRASRSSRWRDTERGNAFVARGVCPHRRPHPHRPPPRAAPYALRPATEASSSVDSCVHSLKMASEYWTVSTGPAVRLFTCRECKDIIYKGAPMVCRDGRKTRLHYHAQCFSGRPFQSESFPCQLNWQLFVP